MVVLIVSTWSHELSTASANHRCYIFGLNHLKNAVADKTFDEMKEKLGDLQNYNIERTNNILEKTELNMCEVDVLNVLMEFKFSIVSQSQDGGMIVWNLVKNG